MDNNINKKIFHFPVKDQEELGNVLLYAHSIYEYVFNGHVGAPIHEKLQNGAKVLEFGCDAGIWITEVAAEYPNSEFYAVDFSIPASNNVDNITFIKCDILQKLPFPDDEFDYVFSRDKFLFFEKNNFYDYLSEILRILKPGGHSWLKSHNIVKDFIESFESYLQEIGKAESMSHQLVKIRLEEFERLTSTTESEMRAKYCNMS
ncbi:5920_t:CDS:2 [Gigaspora rosea]|nr:5920_t:CDS:2 [Gigaspora rosea]